MLRNARRWLANALAPRAPMATRRWDADRTDRTNSAAWLDADAAHVNSHLSASLQTLRNRARLEHDRNALVEGVVNSHCTDIVGVNGPTLQMQTGDREFDRKAEDLWKRWSELPDLCQQLSLSELLDQCIIGRWTDGEYLHQFVPTNETATSGIGLRINTIDPQQLLTPPASIGDASVVLGVKVDATGVARSYWIEDAEYRPNQAATFGKFTEVDAAFIVHGYKSKRSKQRRGIPWLASAAQAISDLREFGIQTLDAARLAADFAALLYTDHDDAEYMEVNESIEIQRRRITTMPPGWKVEQVDPKQPGPEFVGYVREKLRELGRPVGMPLLYVLQDASGHNFSSARFDGQVYARAVLKEQGALASRYLNRTLRMVMREAVLRGQLRRGAPDKWSWLWPTQPQIDPVKETVAENAQLAAGSVTMADVQASKNRDPEQHLDALQAEVEEWRSRGLRHPHDAERPVGDAPSIADLAVADEDRAAVATRNGHGRL